ncbi:MAG: efflux RND transporter periplasmic adaptor subunit [Gammaproteobacteria bacterium]|nr:efflux RND transporter periplasmic adaptor subunit [Gammaproteobacteria bacterium]MBU2057504.1 efflux RND transporter periplasmic adaptor subunit [Gammaproteobacteria bacterium]MBU2176264.1 efflux RND transporter periplasmic adaptor subunit [Gammaproteobacteria bacterium]MBU2245865.1 efflux RND transporter periplasmic adaptor subunit [Gammaproteobacteria bacterium]MBU2344137.1 efflux RND transporter periplasmic adaptor subunit [Gammaproteobacteria bacterium]
MKLVKLVMLSGLWLSCAVVAQQSPAVPVKTAVVQQQAVPVWIRAIGQVKAQQSVEIRPQVDGVLQRILVEEGQLVQAGDLLAVIDDRSIKAALEQAKAQLSVVQAQLDVARLDLKRYQNLRKDQAVSAQMADQQQAIVQQLEAELRSVQATINAQQVELSFTQILSPIAGQVGIRNVDAGNYVRTSDASSLFSVVQLDPISIEIALPQSRLAGLQLLMRQIRQKQTVPVLAYLKEGADPLAQGQLTVVDNRVTSATGTIRVKADFANPDSALWPNQSVVIALQSKVLENALTIPAKALQQGPQGAFVWFDDQGKAATAAVDVVLQDKNQVVVTGVTAGQQVVVDGQSRLRRGSELKVLTDTPQTAATER